jgi:hypothetical protein
VDTHSGPDDFQLQKWMGFTSQPSGTIKFITHSIAYLLESKLGLIQPVRIIQTMALQK